MRGDVTNMLRSRKEGEKRERQSNSRTVTHMIGEEELKTLNRKKGSKGGELRHTALNLKTEKKGRGW